MRRIRVVLLLLAAGASAILRLTDEELQRINEDGSAVHPGPLMKWMLKQEPIVAGIKQKDPEMLEILQAHDIERFQAKMVDMNKGRRLDPEDGSAIYPEEYMMAMRHEAEHYEMKRKDPDLWKVVKKGDIDALQKLLRERHEHKLRAEAMKNAPPPPETPYDDIGQVDMSFRIRKDDGTEMDMFSVKAKDNSEETGTKGLAVHMVCAACAAFTHQAGIALPAAYAMNNKRKKNPNKPRGGQSATEGSFRKALEQVTSETIEEMCANTTLWAHEYGIEPGKSGTNILVGPGIPAHPDSLKGDESIMMQTMHNQHTGGIMARACEEHLLGSEEDEQIGPTAEAALADEGNVSEALHELLCTKRCLMYDINQAEAKPAKKKKKKKGKKEKQEL